MNTEYSDASDGGFIGYFPYHGGGEEITLATSVSRAGKEISDTLDDVPTWVRDVTEFGDL